MAKVQRKLKSSDLSRWRLIEDFNRRLIEVQEEVGVNPSWGQDRRKLELSHYLGLYLFGLLNPVVRSMRALCKASELERVQRDICDRPVSLGSFSEAQHVIDPELLEVVFGQLLQEVKGPTRSKGLPADWRIIDSSLWHVLPRMHWALWRRQGTSQNAVRLHLCLHVVDDKPVGALVAPAKLCERVAWKKVWQKGDAYVGDRNYGADLSLFGELDKHGCSFVLRVSDSRVVEVLEELPLSPEDRSAGVLRQAQVRLGSRKSYHSIPLRMVWVHTQKEVLLLVTNQSPSQLSAQLVSELYRHRWQVELFFRWIKCILGCRHWLAESPQGVTLQVYLALIGALLLQFHAGIRPTKRMMERIQLYLMGYASLSELQKGIQDEQDRLQRQHIKKSKV